MSTRTKALYCRPATCQTCPFRGGFYLDIDRRQEIVLALEGDKTFHCHSEVDYDDYDDFEGDTSRARQCAGASTMLLRDGHPNMVMRFGEHQGEMLIEDAAVPFQTMGEWVTEPEFAQSRKPEGTGEPCHLVGANCTAPAGWSTSGGAATNYAANAEHWCSECGEPTCSECMDTEDRCLDCAEEDY